MWRCATTSASLCTGAATKCRRFGSPSSAMTRSTNQRHRQRHGTTTRGSGHTGGHKLNPNKAKMIRILHSIGAPVRALAARYGTSLTTIYSCINETSWRE